MTEDKLVGIFSIVLGALLIVYALTMVIELIEFGYITYHLKGAREFRVPGVGASLAIFGIFGIAALFSYVGIIRYQGRG